MSLNDESERQTLIRVRYDDASITRRKSASTRLHSFHNISFTQEDDTDYLETRLDNASEVRVEESRQRQKSALEEIQFEDPNKTVQIPPEDKDQEQHGVGWRFMYRCTWLFFVGMGSPLRHPLTWLAVAVNFIAAYFGSQLFNHDTRTWKSQVVSCLQRGCGEPFVPAPGDLDTLLGLLKNYVLSLGAMAMCWFTTKFTGEYITLKCRNTVAEFLQKKLMTGKNYYEIVTIWQSIDNHDQRITTDVQVFFDTFIGLVFGNISCFVFLPLTLLIQGVYRGFIVSVVDEQGNKEHIPYAIEAMLVILAFSILAFILPMRRISNIFYMQQQFEGDLRYSHSRVVTHSESIAFYEGEKREEALADQQFLRVYYNMRRYYKYQTLLLFMQLLIAAQASTAAPYLILAFFVTMNPTVPNKYTKLLEFESKISNSLDQATQLPSVISRLGNVAGACHRVFELAQCLDKISKENEESRNSILASSIITLEDVTIWPAGGGPGSGKAPLFRNLDISIPPGQHLIIMGPSGCGKSSMLRIIAGLWPITKGIVTRPLAIGRGGIFFIPQKVYLPVGTLRDQLLYPSSGQEHGDSLAMASILEDVGLGFLMDKWGLDTVFEWETILSVGERQLLGFARLFWHRPKYALMDEATSALDVPMEAKLLQKCHQLDITMVSVAHRPSTIGHHRTVILFNEATREWDRREVSAAEIQAAEEAAGQEELPQSPLKVSLVREDSDQEFESESEESEDDKMMVKPGPSKVSYFSRIFVNRLAFLFKMTLGPFSLFSRPYLVILIAIGALVVYAMNKLYIASQWSGLGPSDMINKIAQKDEQVFLDIFLISCSDLISTMAVAGAAYIGVVKALHMQRVTMKELHARYFSKKVHYVLNKLDKGLDNIDQRLVQDLGSMVQSMAWLIGSPYAFQDYTRGALGSLLLLCIYVPFAYQLSWSLATCMVCWVFIPMLMIMLAGLPVPKAVANRQNAEGALRSHHARIRIYCESIAFYGGQDVEFKNVDELLKDVYAARMSYLWRSSAVLLVQNLSTAFSLAFPMAAAVPFQFYLPFGKFPTAQTQTIMKFMTQMTHELTKLLQSIRGTPDIAGFSHRVCEVLETANKYQDYEDQMDKHIQPCDTVSFKNVNIAPPGMKRPIIRNLNLTIPHGQSIVVMGPSGCGKSSFLRVLAGLWGIDKGTIFKPKTIGQDGMFFVPQASYVTQGTLREQIVYPDHLLSREEDGSGRAYDDDLVEGILDGVGLLYLVERWGLDKDARWDDVLSGGEQQRLGFARMFFHQPKYAVLDESTSALNVDLEAKCLQECKDRGITMISTSHRPGVIAYHENILRLDGQGNYMLVNAKSVSGGAGSPAAAIK